MTRLLFDLDFGALIFASRTNLESGPRFADIWLQGFRWFCFKPPDFELAKNIKSGKGSQFLATNWTVFKPHSNIHIIFRASVLYFSTLKEPLAN